MTRRCTISVTAQRSSWCLCKSFCSSCSYALGFFPLLCVAFFAALCWVFCCWFCAVDTIVAVHKDSNHSGACVSFLVLGLMHYFPVLSRYSVVLLFCFSGTMGFCRKERKRKDAAFQAAQYNSWLLIKIDAKGCFCFVFLHFAFFLMTCLHYLCMLWNSSSDRTYWPSSTSELCTKQGD